MKRLLLVLASLTVVGLVAPPAHAHSGSYDMKYVDGSNLVLLTFNTHAPVSGLDIEHDLRLYDLTGVPIPYDEVAVEMHTRDTDQSTTLRGSTLVLEQTAPMLPTNESKLTLAYPVRGGYTLQVDFRAGGRDISSGVFAVDVGQGTTSPGGFPWIRLLLTLVAGVVVGTALPRSTRPEQEPQEEHEASTEPSTSAAAAPAAPLEEPAGVGA